MPTSQTLIYNKTDIGFSKETNQDSTYPYDNSTIKNLYAVSDGMGGLSDGDVASLMCIEACEVFNESKLSIKDKLINILNTANENIIAKKKELLIRMGATMDVVYIDDKAYFAHVGDSKIYHFEYKKDILHNITYEDNIPGVLLQEGKLKDLEEARQHPSSNMLLNYVGFKNMDIKTGSFNLSKNDMVILCSDGLTDSMPYTYIQELVIKNKDNDNIGDVLMEETLKEEHDNSDNVALVIIRVGESEKLGVVDRVMSFFK